MSDADTPGDTPEPPGTVVWFNPSCSKCRTVQGILSERGVDANYVRYLEQTPDRAEIEAVLARLGTDDPRMIMRTGEAVYTELGLADADRDALLEAMVANPILIERPIVIRGDRAVVGRPPENVLDLL
jgi:arsenate reductase (glutaredoxin)